MRRVSVREGISYGLEHIRYVIGVGIVLSLSLLIGVGVGFLAINSGSVIGFVFGAILLLLGFVLFYAGLISLGYKVMADAVAKGNQMTGHRSAQSRSRSPTRKSSTTKRRKPNSSSSDSGSVKSRSKSGIHTTDPKSSLISKITLTEKGIVKLILDVSSKQREIRRVKIADFHADNNENISFILLNGKENKIVIDDGYTPVSGVSLNEGRTPSVELTVYKESGRKITSLRGNQFILGLEFHNDSKKEGAVTVPG